MAQRRFEATPDSAPSATPSPSLRGFTGLSQRGQRVTLAEEVGTYVGAQPYFTVRYGVRSGPKGGSDTVRYTPSLARAYVILRHFLSDVTDPEGLADP
jgi:hypothetical protein